MSNLACECLPGLGLMGVNLVCALQAFASGLDIHPACERLQAGLTEAGQALDGRRLVAALDLAASAGAAAPGQQRVSAGAAHAYQLNIELRLSKVYIALSLGPWLEATEKGHYSVCWLPALKCMSLMCACKDMHHKCSPA